MDKYHLWKLRYQGEVFKDNSGTVYYGKLDSVVSEVNEIIQSLQDAEQWREVTPLNTEIRRWQNGAGYFISISLSGGRLPVNIDK